MCPVSVWVSCVILKICSLRVITSNSTWWVHMQHTINTLVYITDWLTRVNSESCICSTLHTVNSWYFKLSPGVRGAITKRGWMSKSFKILGTLICTLALLSVPQLTQVNWVVGQIFWILLKLSTNLHFNWGYQWRPKIIEVSISQRYLYYKKSEVLNKQSVVKPLCMKIILPSLLCINSFRNSHIKYIYIWTPCTNCEIICFQLAMQLLL